MLELLSAGPGRVDLQLTPADAGSVLRLSTLATNRASSRRLQQLSAAEVTTVTIAGVTDGLFGAVTNGMGVRLLDGSIMFVELLTVDRTASLTFIPVGDGFVEVDDPTTAGTLAQFELNSVLFDLFLHVWVTVSERRAL